MLFLFRGRRESQAGGHYQLCVYPILPSTTLHVLLTLGGVVLIVFIPIQYHTRLAPYDSTYLLHLAVYPSFVPILLAHSLKCFFRAFLAQLVLSSSQ